MKNLNLALRLIGAIAFVLGTQSCASQRNFIEVVYYGDSEDSSQVAQKQTPKAAISSESSDLKAAKF